MNTPLQGTPHQDTRHAWRLGYRLRGIVVALAIAAALASHLLLDQTEAAPPMAAALPTSAGVPPQFDHSVVLRQALPDEPQQAGISIGAYSAP
jgi:hypothetical protein